MFAQAVGSMRVLMVFVLCVFCAHEIKDVILESEGGHLVEASISGEASAAVALEFADFPLEMLESPEFASVLSRYVGDVAAERRATECIRWIDLELFKAPTAAAGDAYSAAEKPQGGTDTATTGSTACLSLPPQGRHVDACSSLNKQFGAAIRKAARHPAEEEFPTWYVECTAAPWFAEAVLSSVEEKASPQGSPYFFAHLDYTSPIPEAFSSQMPKALPLSPTRRSEFVDDFVPPQAGDTATLLCLKKGQQLIFSRETEETALNVEFLPGPWTVEVQVELFPNVLRSMGIGVRLRLLENISVTLPPTRVLPVYTSNLGSEQWLTLELAALYAEEQQLQDAEIEDMELRGEWIQADEVPRITQMGTLPIGPCFLRRRKGFNEPVVLDCINRTRIDKKSLLMDAVGLVRRGVVGMALAYAPALKISKSFYSLIKTEYDISSSVVADLSLFTMQREWSMSLPEELKAREENTARQNMLEAEIWTPEQDKLLNVISAEVLQVYARGRKDRRTHTKEKYLTFIETDSKLIVHVPLKYLSHFRRQVLQLKNCKDAELIFTFTDSGGKFHPFHKVPLPQDVVYLKFGKTFQTGGARAEAPPDGDHPLPPESLSHVGNEASKPNQTHMQAVDGKEAKPDSSAASASRGFASLPLPQENQESTEGRITYLQLLWQNVAESHYQELRRVAIENIIWDVGLCAVALLLPVILVKFIGTRSGRATAAALKRSREFHLASFQTKDLAIIPGPREEVQTPYFHPQKVQLSEADILLAGLGESQRV
ncbi:hypothetical protein cyc_00802 [Cyclospora cayetanensis]|uniref:Transmembrane protein n=1 Tax=Cyclospora cayetanensis TaxID=88456 RepID=A0A1D3D8F4_9EIME|nr:hypothetical protein cyc_00802 [Cyclospora cayetanensis]